MTKTPIPPGTPVWPSGAVVRPEDTEDPIYGIAPILGPLTMTTERTSDAFVTRVSAPVVGHRIVRLVKAAPS
jgi:hypothetical protein